MLASARSCAMPKPKLYHIPICPFSQRIEILLELEQLGEAVEFEVVDITVPRPDWMLELSRGSTALPIMDIGPAPGGGARVIKESLVILRYVIEQQGAKRVVRDDPWERAVENMMLELCSPWLSAGYRFLLNQEVGKRVALLDALLDHYAKLDDFLRHYGRGEGPFLFEDFGLAELVFTPFMQRFWFLEYYEDFSLPEQPKYARVQAWQDACVAHPAAQQSSKEEIIKLYYDYALGAGNGALLPGRERSSFVFEPSWKQRPWPPKRKYGTDGASDAELGLL